VGAPRARAGSRQVTGLFVVNVQVVEPWLAAFGPVAFAEYVVPFFNRVDGVTVTVVQGELHITEPLTALPVLSASVTFADFTGASKVAVTVVFDGDSGCVRQCLAAST